MTGTAGAVVSDRDGTWQALSNFSPFDTVSTLSCDESGNCIAAGISLAVDSDGGAFTDVPDDEQPQNRRQPLPDPRVRRAEVVRSSETSSVAHMRSQLSSAGRPEAPGATRSPRL